MLTCIVLLAGCAFTAQRTVSARADLLSARDALTEGREALQGGRTGEATTAFQHATTAAASARSNLSGPPFDILADVPVAGSNIVAVQDLAAAARLLAAAGQELTGAASKVPEAGQPVAALRAAAPRLERAHHLVLRAQELVVGRRGERLLLPPIADAHADTRALLGEAEPALEVAAALCRELPAFLGGDGPRRYFVGAQNPAELRGTGGLIGSYGILTAEGGRGTVSDFSSILELPSFPPHEILSPNEGYGQRYDGYGGAGYWQNLNMTPDFPTAATAIERLYEKGTGERLDGAILADPTALAALLTAAGPVDVPGVGSVEAGNVVALLTNEAYGRFQDPERRREVLADVAGAVLSRTFAEGGGGDLLEVVRSLATAASGGHLLFHSTDADVQEAFDQAGLTGRLLSPDSDGLAVIVNNSGGNKVDFYAERSVEYKVTLHDDGTATGETGIRIVNRAPAGGQPAYVIGPNVEGLAPGENASLLSVYAPGGALLEAFSIGGIAAPISPQQELGHPVYTSPLRLPSGADADVRYRWSTPGAWDGDTAGGSYRLRVQGQPTVQPTRVGLTIILPPGMRVTAATPGLDVSGRRLTYDGLLTDLREFDIAFARPLGDVLRERAHTFWNEPVLRW